MKNYVVSEEEIRQFAVKFANSVWAIDKFTEIYFKKSYFKSKQPLDIQGIDSYLYQEAKRLDMYTNENINVYVEVIK